MPERTRSYLPDKKRGQRRTLEHNGYLRDWCPTRKRYVYQHRLVVEGLLGRFLAPEEIVHHINGDKKDNRPENLELTSRSEHNRTHIAEGSSFAGTPGPRPDLRKPLSTCAWCGKEFKRPRSDVKCCSHSCGQLLRFRGDPRTCDGTGTEAEQDAEARRVWDNGRGCSHWNAC